jgi:hypothetical protein
MNRITKFLSVAAFALLALPAIASAQYNGGYGYPNGGYGYPNGGYGNGGYNNGYYGDIRSASRELKDVSRRFEKDLDRSPLYSKNGGRNNGGWWGGGYGNYGNNDQASYVRKLADQFADAANDLNKEVGNSNGRDYNKGYNEANRVLSLGSQLDSSLRSRGLDNYLQDDWNRIQNALRTVQNYYGNGYNNRNRNGGWNNGRNNGGWNNRPSWWPF